MVPGHHLEKVKVPEEDWPEEDPYSNMTGSLQHMRLTRPDICAALSTVCQFNQKGQHDDTHTAAAALSTWYDEHGTRVQNQRTQAR